MKDIKYCYESNFQGEYYDHFFGQMIFRKCDIDKSEREILEVVDGQQRLTTVTLTIAALYRLILVHTDIIDDEAKKALTSLKAYLISTPKYGSVKRRLSLSDKDNALLIEIATMKEEKISRDISYECKNESQTRILDAYNQVFDSFEKYFRNISKDKYVSELLKFSDIVLSNISVVVLKPDNIGYSYALYQIVNDRGVLLTPAELLKARTMELLHGNNVLFNECEAIWDDILNDAGNETTKYLVWHYVSVQHNSVSKAKLNETYEKNLFKCFGKHKLSIVEQEELSNSIRQLYQSVKWCRELSVGKIPTNNLHAQIEDMYNALVLGLKNEIAIPIYINILKIENEDVKNKFISFITVLISKFFFSTRTISAVHNGTISKTYHYLSAQIASNSLKFDEAIDYCKKVQLNKGVITTFDTKMSDSIYSKTNTTNSKFLLYLLELFDDCNDLTFRHILRRDEASIVCFEKISNEHIATFSGKDGNTLSDNERNSVGNLTLLGINKNTDLDDQPFSVKKVEYEKSPYYLTREVSKFTKWDKTEFETRQNDLKGKVLKIFLL